MTELVKLDATQFWVEKTKAEQIELVFAPMVQMLKSFEDREKEFEISESEITEEICKKAKRLRLDISQVRISTEKTRVAEKEFYLRWWKAIDWIANILKFAIQWKEEKLEKIEKYFEIQEKVRISKLQIERELLLEWFELENLNLLKLWEMSEEVFANFLLWTKSNFEAKKQAERLAKEEEERKQKEEEERRIAEIQEKARIEAEAKVEKDRIEAEMRAKFELERVEREAKEKVEKLEREAKEKELAEQKRKEDEEKVRIEAEKNQERLEKEKAYITYRDSLDFDKFEKEDWKIVFYKKVWEFII